MKRFIAVCVTACFVVLAPVGHVQAFGGHGGGHGGHFGGHFGRHGFHGGHFGGHFGGHSFHGGHFGHFGPFPQRRIFPHAGGFPHGFGHGGFFFHRGGGSFSPFAFRAGPPVVIIKDPFFCFPHGLGFTAQDAFLTHLQDLHGISARRAPAYLIRTGPRLIFLGF